MSSKSHGKRTLKEVTKELLDANKQLTFQNEEKEKRAAELLIANKEIAFQAKLKSKAEEIERFFSLSLDLLCIADREGNFLKVNKTWENILGYPAIELEKRKFLEFVHPEDIEKTIGAMQLSQENQVIDFANRYLCKDGIYKDIEWRSMPYGNLIYAIARDVTDRKIAENVLAQEQMILEKKVTLGTVALHKSEIYNHAILEAIPDMMFVTDADGTFLDFHSSSEDDLLTKPEFFLGKNISQVLPSKISKFFKDKIYSISKTQLSCSHQYSLMIEGKENFFEARMVSCGDQLIMTIVRNVTKKYLLEQKIQEQIQYLSTIHEIDNIVLESQNFIPSLKLILIQVMKQLKTDAGVVFTIEPQTMAIKYAISLGISEKGIEQIQLQDSINLAREAVYENKTIFVPDVSQSTEKITLIDVMNDEGFVSTIIVPLTAKQNNIGVLQIFNRKKFEEEQDWMTMCKEFGSQIAIAIESANTFADLKRSNVNLIQAYDETIEGWSRVLDMRDKETEGHSQRVTEMTLKLAKIYGMNNEELIHVKRGALLHDIGKLGIPDQILLKPDKLNDEEWIIMRKHPQFAYDMLLPISYLHSALDIPYCHHEKYDGSGYPRGISGDQIPVAARIFAIVDVWDALRYDRPYRKAWSTARVTEYIKSLAGTHFDPYLVNLFFRVIVNN